MTSIADAVRAGTWGRTNAETAFPATETVWALESPLELATIAVGVPESGYCPRDWRHSPPGEAAMADEATTTKWTVKHEPVNEDHESQRDASN